jgi:DNA-binding NarL/FixJ family response regulator
VIVFTASQADTDIQAAYELHANCYVPKPIDLDDFLRTIHSIIDFWLNLVQLP